MGQLPPLRSHVKLPGFISALKLITMGWNGRTLMSPSCGLVDMMIGPPQSVTNHQTSSGGSMGVPPASCASLTVMVYTVHPRNGSWVIVWKSFAGGFQLSEMPVTVGPIDHWMLAVFIASLHSKIMSWVGGMATAPGPGVRNVRKGSGQSDLNVQGLGTRMFGWSD